MTNVKMTVFMRQTLRYWMKFNPFGTAEIHMSQNRTYMSQIFLKKLCNVDITVNMGLSPSFWRKSRFFHVFIPLLKSAWYGLGFYIKSKLKIQLRKFIKYVLRLLIYLTHFPSPLFTSVNCKIIIILLITMKKSIVSVRAREIQPVHPLGVNRLKITITRVE